MPYYQKRLLQKRYALKKKPIKCLAVRVLILVAPVVIEYQVSPFRDNLGENGFCKQHILETMQSFCYLY